MLLFQTVTVEIQLLITAAGIAFSGVAAFYGVKLALSKLDGRVSSLEECSDDHDERIKYLERQKH